MKMKMKFFLVSVLALISFHSYASPVGTVFHDYGSDPGKYNPGGNDVLGTDWVTVSDQSTGRFEDVFDFSGSLGTFAGTITSMEMILEFVGSGPECPFGICSFGESWEARLQGSDLSGQNDDLFTGLDDSLSPQSIVINASTDVGGIDVWANSIAYGQVGLWFADNAFGGNSFMLDSATLNVYGEASTASVPLPGSLPLMAFGLLVSAVTRRRRTK